MTLLSLTTTLSQFSSATVREGRQRGEQQQQHPHRGNLEEEKANDLEIIGET